MRLEANMKEYACRPVAFIWLLAVFGFDDSTGTSIPMCFGSAE